MIKKEPYSILNLGEGITVIVITGGPCSGKTTGLARLNRMLSDRGYKVLISPESATKLIMAGMTPGELPWIEFQEEILLDSLSQEERLLSIATRYKDKGRKVVVLCDRGAMDGEAYIGAEAYGALLGRLEFTHRQLCDERYHAVIHLRTAALGAEEFYTLANNEARIETPEEARSLDDRTLFAWTRHQHPRVVDNSTDFDSKLHRLFGEVCAILGDPVPLEKEDKFLIEVLDPATIPVKWTESQITQDYLVSPTSGEERRVRARSDGDSTSYYYTVKRAVSPGVRVEEEKMITHREYEALRTLRNPEKCTIKKRRVCFFWKEQFFEVDLFVEPKPGLALMEAERSDRAPELELPPFIKVLRNVTDDKLYSNSQLATRVRFSNPLDRFRMHTEKHG
jgi:CYTH domain-containing protein/predicted ATPase